MDAILKLIRSFFCILLITLWGSPVVFAGLTYSKSAGASGKRTDNNRQTWYIGCTEELIYFKGDTHGVWVDDGLFVAVPRKGGKYYGYEYFELPYRYVGCVDGGPAYLPENPRTFLEILQKNDLVYKNPIAIEYFNNEARLAANLRGISKFRVWRNQLPLLEKGTILPAGTLFFFWVSRGGGYGIGAGYLSPKLPVRKLKIEARNVPVENDLWHLPSDTVTQQADVYEYTIEEFKEKAFEGLVIN